MRNAHILAVMVVVGMLVGLGGCMDITGRGPAPLADTVGERTTEYSRVGHVYCMRGWLGIFSTGMDSLAQQIDKEVPAVSVADEEWRRLFDWIIKERNEGAINEPLVLLGHSYGADDQIRVAAQLRDAGISVDLLVLIDPVTPPLIPTNVKRAYCVFKSHPETDAVPVWRGVPVACEDPMVTPLVNIDLRTAEVDFDTTFITHPNIEKSEGVHKMVLNEIRKTCPLRSAWAKTHSATPVTQAPVASKLATP